MSVPLIQKVRVGAYIVGKKLSGEKRYPLVLMLEPLFRCNLACPGCGKIDYPPEILNQRLSVDECLQAVDECGAPMVSIPGGEPLIHPEMGEIVAKIIARKKFVYLCTNALLLKKKLDQFTPSKYLTFSVHLDGLEEEHDHAVDQPGTFKRAVAAIKEARSRGFRVNVNATVFDGHPAERLAAFFDFGHGRAGCRLRSRFRPATHTNARPTSSTSSTAARPRSSSATSSRAARARSGASASPASSSTSWPATRISSARPGATRPATFSAGRSPAT